MRITSKGCLHTWDQQTESGWPSSDRLSVYSSNKIGVNSVCECVRVRVRVRERERRSACEMKAIRVEKDMNKSEDNFE